MESKDGASRRRVELMQTRWAGSLPNEYDGNDDIKLLYVVMKKNVHNLKELFSYLGTYLKSEHNTSM